MKYYHLTILRNGSYQTIFGQMSSIESFLAIEKELGYETHIIYARELCSYDYETVKRLGL